MKRTRMVVKHSNLTDKHWRKIANWLPKPHAKGRRLSICRRSVVNAILYINRTGCGWRYLPCDVPNWNTVYGLFRQWAASGVWQRINDHLREQGRKRSPTAAIIDSQSTKTAEADGPKMMKEYGYAYPQVRTAFIPNCENIWFQSRPDAK